MSAVTYTSLLALLAAISVYYYTQSSTPQSQYTVPVQWSTYRPGLYYGLRASHPHSPLLGLMYYSTSEQHPIHFYHHWRHWMEERDNVLSYGTQQHNGLDFGHHTINDTTISNINMSATYVRDDATGQVISRLHGVASDGSVKQHSVSLMWYIALDDSTAQSFDIVDTTDDTITVNIHTEQAELNNTLQLRIQPSSASSYPTRKTFTRSKSSPVTTYDRPYYRAMRVPNHEQWRAKEAVQPFITQKYQQLQQSQQQRMQKYYQRTKQQPSQQQMEMDSMPSLLPTLDNTVDDGANLLVIQYVVELPFDVDVVLYTAGVDAESNEMAAQVGEKHITSIINQRTSTFHNDFTTAFPSVPAQYTVFGQYLLSSLVGGYGYFYGTSVVATPDPHNATLEQLETQPATSLLSTTPCRSFFPRGFLWDEGFHQLVVSQYALNQSLTVLSSWLSLVDASGWLPREQILGDESRARVPAEFQPQRQHIANPPTLILTIGRIAERLRQRGDVSSSDSTREFAAFIRANYDAIHRHVQWYFTTQSSHVNKHGYTTSLAWRGRSLGHCLASGLDDYPRADWLTTKADCADVTDDLHGCEGHVDLHVWMIALCTTMLQIGEFGVKFDADNRKLYTRHTERYQQQRDTLMSTLNTLHWVDANNTYADYTYKAGTLHHQTHVGYVSILPMLLGVVQPNSKQLTSIIEQLSDPAQLYTDYGVRSLSAADKYYGMGEDYWRGNMWMNLNYMTVVGLRHYSSATQQHSTSPLSHTAVKLGSATDVNQQLQNRIDVLYDKVRAALVSNVYKNWQRTGFVYEVYDNKDGVGKRSHPFTGWTTLTLLMMTELY